MVSHTGVGGLSLGGGMGRLQRRYGLTIDNIRAVELVTADGRVVRASEDENPELFWGVRGAGANFGIATRFEFALHPLDGTVTQGSVVHPLERASELAAFFRALVADAPRTLMASFAVAPDEATGGPAAMISVLHSGSTRGGGARPRRAAPLRAAARRHDRRRSPTSRPRD